MTTPRHLDQPPVDDRTTPGWRRAAASGGTWLRQRDTWLMLAAVAAILAAVGGTLWTLWAMFRILTSN